MYTLPTLSYGYDALEPYIDTQTMQIHHTKHHQTYIDKVNAGLEKYPEYATLSIESLVASYPTLPISIQPLIATHGCGHLNHSLMREFFAPQSGSVVDTDRKKYENQITDASLGHFGSGRCWLVIPLGSTDANDITIMTLSNQENPYMYGFFPIFGIDLREHAYYLKNQNRRGDYIKNCLQCTNRNVVSTRYAHYIDSIAS